MIEKKMFRCSRCCHAEVETVPNRLRCPRCGAAIPRPERDEVVRSGASSSARRRVPQFFD
jgi:Zn finger protein HypA/HybF involved in hydrogenase expression